MQKIIILLALLILVSCSTYVTKGELKTDWPPKSDNSQIKVDFDTQLTLYLSDFYGQRVDFNPAAGPYKRQMADAVQATEELLQSSNLFVHAKEGPLYNLKVLIEQKYTNFHLLITGAFFLGIIPFWENEGFKIRLVLQDKNKKDLKEFYAETEFRTWLHLLALPFMPFAPPATNSSRQFKRVMKYLLLEVANFIRAEKVSRVSTNQAN